MMAIIKTCWANHFFVYIGFYLILIKGIENIIVLKKMNNKSVVKSGLKVGDVMVTNGFINLFENANVSIK